MRLKHWRNVAAVKKSSAAVGH